MITNITDFEIGIIVGVLLSFVYWFSVLRHLESKK